MRKAIIRPDGFMLVVRGETEEQKPAYCPFGKQASLCGDWCVLFREPGGDWETEEAVADDDSDDRMERRVYRERQSLTGCHVVVFNEIWDYRTKQAEEYPGKEDE